RDVVDGALLLQAIDGHDPRDATSSWRPVPEYLATLTDGVKGMRLGVPKEYFVAGMEPAVEQSIRDAIRLLEQQGASIEEVSLPPSDVALPAYYIIAPAEASSNLARYDGTRYGFQAGGGRNLIEEYMLTRQQGFGAEVKRRIMLGTYALSSGYYDAYYLQAQKVRTLIIEDFKQAFKKVDALLGATSPTAAFELGAKTQDPVATHGGGGVSAIATRYEVVVGLEVHAQILTQSKMFCGCSTDYLTAPPNANTCPVCLGLPGSLPVINRRAVEATIRTALALNCEIPEFSKFDR